MSRTAGWALLALLGLVSVSAGMDTPGKGGAAPTPKVERLIEQLGNRDFKVRAAASRALEDMGPPILPALKKAQGHTDPEVRRRLAELIPTLERIAVLAPKRVTLKLTQRTARQAIAAISKQSGFPIEIWPPAGNAGTQEKQVFTFNLENVPFWEAFDEVCSAAGLVLQHSYGMEQLRLYFQESHVPFVYHSGPFRVVGQSFNYHKSIDFSALPRNQFAPGSRSENLSFNFTITVEPRLPLLGLQQPKILAALDDQNNSMVPVEVPNQFHHSHYYHYGNNRTYTQQTAVNLAWPSKEARTVKLVKGTVPATLLVNQIPDIVVDQLLTVKNKKFKGTESELTVDEVSEQPGKTYQVKMSLRYLGKSNTSDYTWVNSLYHRLEIHDAKGNKLQSRGWDWGNNSATHVQGRFMFGDNGNGKAGKPVKLVYYRWVTMQHQVPFEFKNLPLP